MKEYQRNKLKRRKQDKRLNSDLLCSIIEKEHFKDMGAIGNYSYIRKRDYDFNKILNNAIRGLEKAGSKNHKLTTREYSDSVTAEIVSKVRALKNEIDYSIAIGEFEHLAEPLSGLAFIKELLNVFLKASIKQVTFDEIAAGNNTERDLLLLEYWEKRSREAEARLNNMR